MRNIRPYFQATCSHIFVHTALHGNPGNGSHGSNAMASCGTKAAADSCLPPSSADPGISPSRLLNHRLPRGAFLTHTFALLVSLRTQVFPVKYRCFPCARDRSLPSFSQTPRPPEPSPLVHRILVNTPSETIQNQDPCISSTFGPDILNRESEFQSLNKSLQRSVHISHP